MTTIDGTIVCLDGGFYRSSANLVIDKSITIDCSTAGSSAIHLGFSGSPLITINIPASDPLGKVRLRGLTLLGGYQEGGALTRIARGIDIVAAKQVFVENAVIADFGQSGIFDHRTGGQTKLFVTDTVISGNGVTGIGLGSQGPNTTVLDNVRSNYNAYGLAAATGNNVAINRSVFSGNSTAGVEGDPGAQIVVSNSTISHNSAGVQSAASVRLRNNDISFNSVAVSGASGSLGGNTFSGNSTVGTAPTPVGGAPADIGP